MEKQYWRINTDRYARSDIRTCDLWYAHHMVFMGDHEGDRYKHAHFLEQISEGDEVFMHHRGFGIVGCGVVRRPWNGIVFMGDDRKLYREEPYEYQLEVDWGGEFDCRDNPVPIKGRLPYLGPFSHVELGHWNVERLKSDLKFNADREKWRVSLPA